MITITDKKCRTLLLLAILTFGTTSGQGTSNGCKCINIYKCHALLDLLRVFGKAAGDFVTEVHCGFEGQDPMVCCPLGNNGDLITPSNRRHITARPVNGPSVLQLRMQNLEDDFAKAESDHCGFSDAQHKRIVGGVPAQRGAWPWLAALGYSSRHSGFWNMTNVKWLCGGSLISRQHVLTAAHCVFGRPDLHIIRLGGHELTNSDIGNDHFQQVDIGIERKVSHPEYNVKTFENDIAVVTLEREIEFTVYKVEVFNVPEWIRPICLPDTHYFENFDVVGYSPFVAGWGTVQYKGPSSSVLREVQVTVQPNDYCDSQYRQIKQSLVIDQRVLCAGYEAGGKDACQGDSGGPLMLPINGLYWCQIGIVSYGHRCAEPNYPGVYTRVDSFINFITNSTKFKKK